jgi:GT2 family glycosyltransferase
MGLLSLRNLYRHGCTHITEGIYLPLRPSLRRTDRAIWGCNWGIAKEHILMVNGFDEDYTLPCFGEDIDIDWRLKASGLRLVSLKNQAIQYHLYHAKWYDHEIEQRCRRLYEQKRMAAQCFCTNGLQK